MCAISFSHPLQHNLGMASVVKSMLSLEDYLVGNYLGSGKSLDA